MFLWVSSTWVAGQSFCQGHLGSSFQTNLEAPRGRQEHPGCQSAPVLGHVAALLLVGVGLQSSVMRSRSGQARPVCGHCSSSSEYWSEECLSLGCLLQNWKIRVRTSRGEADLYEVMELSDPNGERAVGWLCPWVSRECGQKWLRLLDFTDPWHDLWLFPQRASQEREINQFSIKNTLKILHLEGLITAFKISEAQKRVCLAKEKRSVEIRVVQGTPKQMTLYL